MTKGNYIEPRMDFIYHDDAERTDIVNDKGPLNLVLHGLDDDGAERVVEKALLAAPDHGADLLPDATAEGDEVQGEQVADRVARSLQYQRPPALRQALQPPKGPVRFKTPIMTHPSSTSL